MELEELVIKASMGDDYALNQLYNETYRQAYQVAMQIFHDEHEVFDILQDSYIKAFNSLAKLKEPSKFKSWFFQIVSNTCRDYLRKRKNNPMFFSDMTYEDDNGENEVEFVDESTAFSPESNVDYSETKRLIAEMIDNLPEEQRLVLLMYYVQELSIKEIAQSLEVSENTVKSRMNYGKKKLKLQVEELEKKGTKLYSIAGFSLFGFIVWMLRTNAQSIPVPDISNFVAVNSGALPLSDTVNSQSTNPQSTNSQSVSSSAQNAQPSVQNSSYGSAGQAVGGVAKATAAVAKKASKHIAAKVIGGVVAASVAGTATAAVVSPEFRRNIDVFGLFTGPETTVEIFEKALNNNDVEKMIGCLPPDTQSAYHAIIDGANGFGNMIGLNNLITTDSIGRVLGFVKGGQMADLTVVNTSYSDSKDTAVLTVNVSYGSYVENSTIDINMQKISNKWYIKFNSNLLQ